LGFLIIYSFALMVSLELEKHNDDQILKMLAGLFCFVLLLFLF